MTSKKCIFKKLLVRICSLCFPAFCWTVSDGLTVNSKRKKNSEKKKKMTSIPKTTMYILV